jgi:hypothetical protein
MDLHSCLPLGPNHPRSTRYAPSSGPITQGPTGGDPARTDPSWAPAVSQSPKSNLGALATGLSRYAAVAINGDTDIELGH